VTNVSPTAIKRPVVLRRNFIVGVQVYSRGRHSRTAMFNIPPSHTRLREQSMKKLGLLLSALLTIGSPLYADIVTDWNTLALNAIRSAQTPPPQASRHLAILHAAIYDAVNGITRSHHPYFVQSGAPSSASTDAAASAAAREVLVAFFPHMRPTSTSSMQPRWQWFPTVLTRAPGFDGDNP
jgi:hypothetical protein